jgi:hypothetical protein
MHLKNSQFLNLLKNDTALKGGYKGHYFINYGVVQWLLVLALVFCKFN